MAGTGTLPESNIETSPTSNLGKNLGLLIFASSTLAIGGSAVAVLAFSDMLAVAVGAGVITVGVLAVGGGLLVNAANPDERHKRREERMEEGMIATPLLSSYLESQKAQPSVAAPTGPKAP